MSISKSCAIVGAGNTEYGKLPTKSAQGLAVEACIRAMQDAGITKDDVDGLLSQQPYFNPTLCHSLTLARLLGIDPLRYSTDLNTGGASPISMVQHAALAIDAGLCTTVLCVFAENMRTAHTVPQHGRYYWGTEDFYDPFGMAGFAPAAMYACAAQRHMYEYGTTHEHLGHVAITFREHASKNPNAMMRQLVTMEEYLASRWIAEPFRVMDCSLVSDGGGALVVTSAERAHDLPQSGVLVLGTGECHTRMALDLTTDPLTGNTGAKLSGEMALRQAGVSLKDIDVAEIYDCFTYTVLVHLEDYGFCKPGESGPFVADGNISLGGAIPVNTHGGLLSEAHVDGMNHILEGVRQLRGECGERQVPDAEIVLVSGNGGMLATHSTLILGKM